MVLPRRDLALISGVSRDLDASFGARHEEAKESSTERHSGFSREKTEGRANRPEKLSRRKPPKLFIF